MFIIAGVSGTIVMSIIADTFKNFKLLLKILTIGSFVCGICTIQTLPTGNLTLCLTNMAFLGVFMIPIAPICGNFAAELTAPKFGEAISYGCMFFIAQITGTGVSLFAAEIITHMQKKGEMFETDGPVLALMTFNICFLIGMIAVCFIIPKSRDETIKEITM